MATLGEKAVGTKVKIPINGTLTNFIIVHKGNPNTQMYDTSCDGTWLVMENAYEKRMWNSVKSTDYENSEIHAWLNSTFYNLIDSAVRNGIKSVKIPYRKGETGTSVSYGANGLSTKVFLLSLKEYAPSESSYTSSAIPNDGDQLSYFTSDTKRAAKIGSSNTAQHTRTPYTAFNTDLCLINGYGKMSTTNSTYSSGIRPAFIFDSNAEYNSDGTLTVKTSMISGSVNIDGVQRELTGTGYININGVLREIAGTQMDIGGILKSSGG